MVDILSGVFTGGNHGGKVKDPFDDFSGPQNIGHLFITFKTNLFVKDYNSRIKNNIKTIKKLPKIKGVKNIMYPGENKFKRFKMNSKKDIKELDNCLEAVEKIWGVSYKRTDTGDDGVGVIAQEVQEVVPELVKEVEGLNGEDSFLTVSYEKLVPVLIESIKEQQKQIDELRKLIDRMFI